MQTELSELWGRLVAKMTARHLCGSSACALAEPLSACALARIQHAGSGDLSGWFTAKILAQHRNKEVEMEFLANEVPEFFALPWNFFWRHVNSSQQINVPIKGKKDAEFSFVHILGRARAVGNECRVESATQIRDLLRTGDYVSTCVHARTKYASRMA